MSKMVTKRNATPKEEHHECKRLAEPTGDYSTDLAEAIAAALGCYMGPLDRCSPEDNASRDDARDRVKRVLDYASARGTRALFADGVIDELARPERSRR